MINIKGIYVSVGKTVILGGKKYVCVYNPHFPLQGLLVFEYADGIRDFAVSGKLACAPFGRHDKTDVVFKEIDSDDVTEK